VAGSTFSQILRGLVLIGALSLSACTPTVTVHGYVPSPEDIQTIEVGIDTKASLEERLGRPSSSGLLAGSDWYYVQSTFSQLAFNPARPTDRTVVAVGFDESDVVTSVDVYGLEDGRIINLNPRITITAGQRRNVLVQIFGGLLNLDASQVLGDN